MGILVVLVGLGAAFWWLSAPGPAVALPDQTADAANGERVFYASGCASCHAAPDAKDEAKLVLAGGMSLETPLGAIVVPNISTDPQHGIGGWSTQEFVNAVHDGVSPSGAHYTPAFPWTSYRNMRVEEVIDLKAFLDTLPPSTNAAEAEGLPFPFGWRRPIGLWKRIALTDPPRVPEGADDTVRRGHYLTVAMGHCAECHTSRTLLLATEPSRWLAGAPNPEGDGKVPNITPSDDGIGSWPQGDIAYLLETGFTPEFDSVGSSMAAVVDNWSKVPADDRAAVAAYLKSIEPLPDAPD